MSTRHETLEESNKRYREYHPYAGESLDKIWRRTHPSATIHTTDQGDIFLCWWYSKEEIKKLEQAQKQSRKKYFKKEKNV